MSPSLIVSSRLRNTFALCRSVRARRSYLEVAVHNLDVVQGLEPADYLDKDLPDVALEEVRSVFLVVGYLLEEVPVVSKLDNQATRVRSSLECSCMWMLTRGTAARGL